MGLMKCSVGILRAQTFLDVREATVTLKKDVVLGSELDQVFVLVIVVGAEGNLLQVGTRVSALVRKRCVPD